MEIEAEQIVGHDAHLFIGLHVVNIDGVHVVESLVEGLRYLYFQVDLGVENTDFLELDHLGQVGHLLLVGISAFQFLDQHAVNAQSEKVLHLPFQWQHVALLEAQDDKLSVLLEYFLIVGKMLALFEHLSRIFKRVKQKLETFASVWIFSLPLEYARKNVLAKIQVVTALKFLNQNLIIS